MIKRLNRSRRNKVFWLLGIALMGIAFYSLSAGAVTTTLHQVAEALIAPITGAPLSVEQQVIVHLRLPRLLFALLVGAGLAGAGVACQGLFRNPLADPAMIGVAAGAALGAALTIVLGSAIFSLSITPSAFVALGAFIGGLAAVLCVWLIGHRSQGIATLLLAGIAINAIIFAAIGLLQYLANDQQLRDLTFWSLGSLSAANWLRLAWVAPCIMVSILLLAQQSKVLNALALGENEAQYLGFSVQKSRHHILFFTALCVGAAVAFTGVISFVGLVVPHLLRLILGADHRYLLPAAALGGALLVASADVLARTLIIPAELPLGVLISLVGGPFFLWLLLHTPWRNTP